MIKVDLHNHLGRNGANPGFDETIDIAYSRLGDGGIFGVANFDDYRYERFVEQRGGKYNRFDFLGESGKIGVYVPEKNMLVLKCQEISTEGREILAIAMPHRLNIKAQKPHTAVSFVKGVGGILDAVHPFYVDGFLPTDEDLDLFSTFEVYNGSAIWVPGFTPRNANGKALDYYINTNLNLDDIGMSSSTDGHSAEVIGTCYTILNRNSIPTFLPRGLDVALRGVKSLDNLHMQPNTADALKHGLDVAVEKVKNKLRR